MSLGFHYHSEGFCDLLAHRENGEVSWGGHFLTYNFSGAGKGNQDKTEQKSSVRSREMLL